MRGTRLGNKRVSKAGRSRRPGACSGLPRHEQAIATEQPQKALHFKCCKFWNEGHTYIQNVLGSSQSCYQIIPQPQEEALDKKSFSHLFGSWWFKFLHFVSRSLQIPLQQASPRRAGPSRTFRPQQCPQTLALDTHLPPGSKFQHRGRECDPGHKSREVTPDAAWPSPQPPQLGHAPCTPYQTE